MRAGPSRGSGSDDSLRVIEAESNLLSATSPGELTARHSKDVLQALCRKLQVAFIKKDTKTVLANKLLQQVNRSFIYNNLLMVNTGRSDRILKSIRP